MKLLPRNNTTFERPFSTKHKKTFKAFFNFWVDLIPDGKKRRKFSFSWAKHFSSFLIIQSDDSIIKEMSLCCKGSFIAVLKRRNIYPIKPFSYSFSCFLFWAILRQSFICIFIRSMQFNLGKKCDRWRWWIVGIQKADLLRRRQPVWPVGYLDYLFVQYLAIYSNKNLINF